MIPTTTTNSPKPQPAALRVYLRQSLSEDKQADSIEAQRGVIEQYARAQGLPWIERLEYKDIDRSGDDFTREDLLRLIAETQPGDLILTRDDSRIGRDALDTAVTVRELVARKGARLYYVAKRQEVQFKNALDAGMAVLQGMGAAMELENIRSRTRDALHERARRGYAAGMVPFGYRTAPVNPSDDNSLKRIEIDPDAAKIVRRIFEEFVAGLGYVALSKKLNREGVPSPRERGWSPACLWELVRNKAYAGFFEYGIRTGKRAGGRVIVARASEESVIRMTRPELAILDEALWTRTQSEIASRYVDMRGNCVAAKHPLSGLLRCGACGSAMRIRTSDGGRRAKKVWHRHYYICSNRARTGRCTVTRSMPADIAEKALADLLLADVLPRAEREAIEFIRREIQRIADTRAGDATAIETELEALRKEQRRLVRVLAQTDEAVPELMAEMKEQNTRIKRLERNLLVATAPTLNGVTARQIEVDAADYLLQLRTKLASGNRDLLREVLVALFPAGLRYRSEGGGGAWIIEGSAVVNTIKNPSDIRARAREQPAPGERA